MDKKRIVYLFGAGGSHACVKMMGASKGLLMKDLVKDLIEKVRSVVMNKSKYDQMSGVFNNIVTAEADIEHLITFFDDSPSAVHRAFADELRRAFEDVLGERLNEIERELGDDRTSLYAALLDMYNVGGIEETLHGIMTLNYDDYIETAVEKIYGDRHVDLNFIAASNNSHFMSLLKLHGSFEWEDAWPIRRRNSDNGESLWIPPGIRKAKERYPFNMLWGRAHDMLNCDVLRVVGCRLAPSDWDLISLIFSTMHANHERTNPYVVEIIDSPAHAVRLKKSYPYLEVRSLFEIETLDVGETLVGEFLGSRPQPFNSLSANELDRINANLEGMEHENWFRRWLILMGEGLQALNGSESTDTNTGTFRKWLEI